MDAATQSQKGQGLAPVAAFYFFLFTFTGISLPFLSQHLRALGLSGWEIGLLVALSPVMTTVAPPLWGFFADRTRRTALLLSLASAGYLVAATPLLFATTFWTIAPWLLVAAFFSSPLSMLTDSLTLERLQTHGGDYARVRLWGSLGFIVGATLFGFAYDGGRHAPPPVIVGMLAAMGTTFAASLFVHGRGAAQPHLALSDAAALLRDRRVVLLLAATTLHWIACAPYHMLFAVYLKDLGLHPRVAGAGMSVGVFGEVVMMLVFPRLLARLDPKRLLAASFALSSLRWALVGVSHTAAAMVFLQILHAFTFGAFLLASITWLAAVVPTNLRATGQALFVAVTYGVGGIVGFVVTGRLFDLTTAARLFMGGAALEWLPFAVVLLLPLSGTPWQHARPARSLAA